MNRIVINGITHEFDRFDSINVTNNNICVNGQDIPLDIIDGRNIKIVVHGDVGRIESSANVEIHGLVRGLVDCSGNCSINGDVGGNIDCSGSVVCGKVEGNVDCSGNIMMRK